LGIALVAGKKRVPNPATGKTAFRTRSAMIVDLVQRMDRMEISATEQAFADDNPEARVDAMATPERQVRSQAARPWRD
jgi:hypothetical protein